MCSCCHRSGGVRSLLLYTLIPEWLSGPLDSYIFHLFNDIKTLNIPFYCKNQKMLNNLSLVFLVQSIHNIEKNVSKECFQKVL